MSFREISGVVAVCDALCGAEGPVADTFAEALQDAEAAGRVMHFVKPGTSRWNHLLCPACDAEAVGMPVAEYVWSAQQARARKAGAV